MNFVHKKMKIIKTYVNMSRVAVVSLLLLVAVGADAASVKMRPVPTVTAKLVSAVESRYFPGQVRASKRVELAFNVSGQLQTLNAWEGTDVQEGDLLAQLDQRDFQYALDAAKADFQNAKLTYDRKLKLYNDEVISKAEIDQAEAVFLASRARMDKARKDFEDTSLYAPFDALVSRRLIENFEQVVAKKTVLSLQDVSEVEIVLKVPEKLMATGNREDIRSIKVKFDADHDVWYNAALSEYASQANPITKTYDAVVKLPSPDGLNTFSGMTASVRVDFVSDEKVGGIRVPLEAIFVGADYQSYVWVIPALGGPPVKTEVVTSGVSGGQIVVLEGLQEGDLIAIAGIHTLHKGMQVRPANPEAEGLEQ